MTAYDFKTCSIDPASLNQMMSRLRNCDDFLLSRSCVMALSLNMKQFDRIPLHVSWLNSFSDFADSRRLKSKIPTPGNQFIGEKSRRMFDYKTVVNWPARCLTAFIHINHIFSYLYGTILLMGTIQSISWYHNYPPLFVTVLYIAIPMGLGFCTSKAWLLEFHKGLQTSIYTRNDSNDEIAHSGNPYNEWSVHRMIVSFLCKCLAFISDETQAERPIGLRMSAYANSEDREVGWVYHGLSLVCFFVVFLVFVIWLASVFGLVFLWMKLMKDFCGIISEPSKRVVKLLFCAVLPCQSVTENLVRYCDWPKNHYIAMLVYPSGVF